MEEPLKLLIKLGLSADFPAVTRQINRNAMLLSVSEVLHFFSLFFPQSVCLLVKTPLYKNERKELKLMNQQMIQG